MSATIDNDKKVFYVGINPPTGNYNDLENKPAIDGVELSSDTTLGDLGLSDVFDYKGQKPTYNDLPKSGNKKGDVWNVADTGENYAWSGSEWDCLTGTDVVNYVNGQLEALNQPITIDALKNEIINFSPNYTFKENWRNNSNVTTETFLSDVYSDSTAAPGMTFVDELKTSDLPTGISTSTGQSIKLVNAEAVMEIMPCAISGVSKVIHVTITSGNVAPHRWELTYWVSGNTVNYSHWIAFQSELVAGNGINISFDDSSDKYIISSDADPLPSQAGNANKLLSTDGIDAYWMTKDYYQSLSSTQKLILETDGTYNNKDVSNNTIFIGDDGIAKIFTKEDLGVDLEKTTYDTDFLPCNTEVIENSSHVLYAVLNGTYNVNDKTVATKLYKSINGGKNWELVNSNRSTDGFYNYQDAKQSIFYLDEKYYILWSTYDGGGGYPVKLDVSSDLENWERINIGNTSSFNYMNKTNIISINGKLIIQNTETGILFRVWNQNNGWYVRQLSNISDEIYSFDNKLVTKNKYSTNEGETWKNSDSYWAGPCFIKDNKFYTQSRPSFSSNASIQVSYDGISYENVGTYEDIGISAMYFDEFFTYENSNNIFARCGSNIFLADYVEGVLKWTLIGEDFGYLDRAECSCVSSTTFFLKGSNPSCYRGKYATNYRYSVNDLTYDVPIPTAADTDKYLKGDGTWAEVQGGSQPVYNPATESVIF